MVYHSVTRRERHPKKGKPPRSRATLARHISDTVPQIAILSHEAADSEVFCAVYKTKKEKKKRPQQTYDTTAESLMCSCLQNALMNTRKPLDDISNQSLC